MSPRRNRSLGRTGLAGGTLGAHLATNSSRYWGDDLRSSSYHAGSRRPVRRGTPSDGNEIRTNSSFHDKRNDLTSFTNRASFDDFLLRVGTSRGAVPVVAVV